MNTLLVEIIACVAAAALLSLLVGWAIRGAMANRQLQQTTAQWRTKNEELQLKYDQDTEQLSDDVQHLETEVTQLNARNTNMSESLRDNEISVQKARANAIELNRQQANTQERLQRIIQQKDEEIKSLKESGVSAEFKPELSDAAQAESQLNNDKIASLSAKREAWERERAKLLNDMEGENQETVAIDPEDIPLDRTVRINDEQMAEIKDKARNRAAIKELESDKTQTLDEADQTITIDYHDPLRSTKQTPNKHPSPGGSPDDDD